MITTLEEYNFLGDWHSPVFLELLITLVSYPVLYLVLSACALCINDVYKGSMWALSMVVSGLGGYILTEMFAYVIYERPLGNTNHMTLFLLITN